MITITGMDDFPTAVSVFPIPLSDGRMAIAATHGTTPGTSEIAYSAAYLVNAAGSATKVGQSEPSGKDIACAVAIIGTVFRLIVSEAVPGGGGATARLDWYDFPIGVGVALGSGGVDQQLRNALALLPK